MSRKLIILLSFLVPMVGFSQSVIINGTVGNRNLKWEDFTGTPDANTRFSAYTYWNLNYRYPGVSIKGDTAVFNNLTAELRLNPDRTWIRKGRESDRLLKHEQGHFDIGHLAMLEFLKRAKETVFYRNDFREQIQVLFSEVLKKHKDMGAAYDQETKHFNDEKQQQRWDSFLKLELEKYGVNKP